jgi:hypothetical protein
MMSSSGVKPNSENNRSSASGWKSSGRETIAPKRDKADQTRSAIHLRGEVAPTLSCLKTLPRFGGAFYTYRAAVARWPRARITLRQGARVVMKTWTE